VVFEGPIRHAIHSLKYRRNEALGDALAPYLAGYAHKLGWQVDLVVPVPSGKQRMKERGYNQVGLLAMPLAAIQKWRYSPGALVRMRETRSQVGLSPMERKEKKSGAFQADPALVAGKEILLLDDVVTTGATFAACSEALNNAGAKYIYALTLARALPHHGLQIV
jgi:ComF family protein